MIQDYISVLPVITDRPANKEPRESTPISLLFGKSFPIQGFRVKITVVNGGPCGVDRVVVLPNRRLLVVLPRSSLLACLSVMMGRMLM